MPLHGSPISESLSASVASVSSDIGFFVCTAVCASLRKKMSCWLVNTPTSIHMHVNVFSQEGRYTATTDPLEISSKQM